MLRKYWGRRCYILEFVVFWLMFAWMKMRENLFWLKKFSDGPISFWIGFFFNLKPPSFPFCFFWIYFFNFFCLFFCFCFGEYVDMDSLSVFAHIHTSLVWNQIVKQDFDVQRRVRVIGFDLGNTGLQLFVMTLFSICFFCLFAWFESIQNPKDLLKF